MSLKRSALVAMLLIAIEILVTSATSLCAQQSIESIVFAGISKVGGASNIYQLREGENTPSIMGDGAIPGSYVASEDGRWVAYTDFLGGSLLDVTTGGVRQIFPAVINPTVPTRMVFQWLPDNSSVLFSILDDPSIHGLTYGGILEVNAEFASIWPWLACDQIMQNRQTGEPGLVCGYPSDAPRVETPEQVVVHWGHEPIPFDANAYLPLFGQSGQSLPPYAWFRDGEQETIIFYGSVGANTNPDFYIVSAGTAVRTLLPSAPGRQPAFDVASDHQQIAVISRNTNSDGLWVDCVRVYSIDTGALAWGGNDEACSPAFADPESGGFTEVAWYPNENQLVIAGRSPEQGAYLRRVNLDSGEDAILLQGYEVIDHLFVAEMPAEAGNP